MKKVKKSGARDSLADSIPQLEIDKTVIIKNWTSTNGLKSLMSEYIDIEIFAISFASEIYDYFLKVIGGSMPIGDCPAMRAFLDYCSDRGLPQEKLYLICSAFRNSFVLYFLESGLLTKEHYNTIAHIFDQNLSGVLSEYSNMLERKQEQLLDHQYWADQYAKIIDNLLIISKCDLSGVITYVNDNFCKVSGYTREELVGRSHSIIRHEDSPPEIFEELWENISSKRPWAGIIKNRCKDGSPYYVSTIVFPILDRFGNIVEYMSTRTDLTQLFVLQEEKKHQDALLIQQTKMAEMGDMLGVITHQWNQPLTSISILAEITKELLEDRVEESYAQAHKKMDAIIAQVRVMSDVITHFKNFFKPSIKEELFMVCEASIDTYKLLEPKLKKLGVSFVLPEHKHKNVKGFLNEFKQVMLNIYNNACDAITEKKIKNGKIELSFEDDGKFMTLIIRDNGGGIKEELLPNKLFEQYVTSKGDSGTGIGLHLSRLVIEKKMHGKISAANYKDGAEFRISLPIHDEINNQ